MPSVKNKEGTFLFAFGIIVFYAKFLYVILTLNAVKGKNLDPSVSASWRIFQDDNARRIIFYA